MKNERNITSTELLYENDSYLKEFEATVISCEESENGRYALILDRTAFFPEGGGQKSDTGTIENAEVFDVQRIEGQVIHYVSDSFKEGSTVHGSLNFEERFEKMQNHSGEHLICGIIHNLYGYDNVGFHLDSDLVTTVDIDGYLTPEQLKDVELRANQVIYSNAPITVSYPREEELATIEFRSKLELSDGIRLVTIEGVDVCACCAPHVKSCGEIGITKIITSFKHRGGTRFLLKSGMSAYIDYLSLDSDEKSLMDLLSVSRGDAYEAALKLNAKCLALQENNSTLKKELTDMVTKSVLDKLKARDKDDTSPELIFTETMDEVQLRALINSCVESYPIIVAGFMKLDSGGYRFIIRNGNNSSSIGLKEIAERMRSELGAKGGGNDLMIQGNVNKSEDEIRSFLTCL